eukprot:c24779_g1_i1 orf=158-2008(-)
MCSASIPMDNQVFLFGSFSEDEASHFQFISESPGKDKHTGGLSPLSSLELVKNLSGSDEPKKASPAAHVVATGNGNLKQEGSTDLGTRLGSLTSREEANSASCNGGTYVSSKEHPVVHTGNGVMGNKEITAYMSTIELELTDKVTGTENISGVGLIHKLKDLRTDSDVSTLRGADASTSHGDLDFSHGIPVSPVIGTGKTWASLLDNHSNGSPGSKNPKTREIGISKGAKAMQVTELSGDLWHRSLKEVEVAGKRLQPRGLINKGNLCFLNATLQALLSCSPFVHLLHTLQARGVPEVGYPTLRACVDFFKEFEFQQHEDGRAKVSFDVGKPFVPSMFDSVLQLFSPHQPSTGAARSRQEDAQEFLSFTMDHLHDEILRLEGTTQIAVSGNHMPAVANEEDDWETVGPKNRTAVVRTHTFRKSALSDIFGGELCSVVKTKGSKASATVQPFLVLHLDILPEAVHTVEDALKLFAAPETLDGYKTTAGKAAVVSASKSVKLQSLPQVLILHVKRFSYGAQGSSKLHKSLHFPLNLTLGRDLLATTASSGSESRSYELVATVTHHGKDPSRGHYTAHSKQLNGQWLRYDDGMVSTVGVGRVLQDLVYLLFYKRCVNMQ